MSRVLVLAGDGIGPEVCAAACEVLQVLDARFSLGLDLQHGAVGGASIEAHGSPLSDAVLQEARNADAVLFGAVGGPEWDDLPMQERPEYGLLRLRSELDLFVNLRPALVFDELADASSLKPELVRGLDVMIVRELAGGIYFGEPRGIRELTGGEREGFNTCRYSESEIRRLAHQAFAIAARRGGRLCSVDKANVLEVTSLWREVFTETAQQYPEVTLNHMYIDNAAMQLLREPKQFDVIAADNMFGDILSDEAAMLTGSIGMLPSASLNDAGQGLYEPCHGSAPDIAGSDAANPMAMILSAAMMLRHSLKQPEAAQALEGAVQQALRDGLRTPDIAAGGPALGTAAMASAIAERCR